MLAVPVCARNSEAHVGSETEGPTVVARCVHRRYRKVSPFGKLISDQMSNKGYVDRREAMWVFLSHGDASGSWVESLVKHTVWSDPEGDLASGDSDGCTIVTLDDQVAALIYLTSDSF